MKNNSKPSGGGPLFWSVITVILVVLVVAVYFKVSSSKTARHEVIAVASVSPVVSTVLVKQHLPVISNVAISAPEPLSDTERALNQFGLSETSVISIHTSLAKVPAMRVGVHKTN